MYFVGPLMGTSLGPLPQLNTSKLLLANGQFSLSRIVRSGILD